MWSATMIIRPSGRSGLILTLFMCFAGLSPATAGSDDESVAAPAKSETVGGVVPSQKNPKQLSSHWKRNAHRKSNNVALKSPADKKVAATEGNLSSAISPSLANANAELQKADTPLGDAARAMSARASSILKVAVDKPAGAQLSAGAPVISADQLNDVDLALHESPPAKLMMMAAADAPAAPAASVAVAAPSNGSSAWDQTSLIGKIFIGFGALLTLASAARMFIA
jgi:hypothetical protein